MSKTKREIRHERIRATVSGTAERPRLCVFRSSKNIYAQIVDDVKGVTLVSVSTVSKELKGKDVNATVEGAGTLGELLAKKALEKGVKVVCFDRGGYRFHGKVKSLADGARKGGLEF